MGFFKAKAALAVAETTGCSQKSAALVSTPHGHHNRHKIDREDQPQLRQSKGSCRSRRKWFPSH